MIVAFCGHAGFLKTEECAQRLLALLNKIVGDQPAEMYLGGYGNYPEIEDKPKKYAITYRNRYMMEQADFVIAYVSHNFGGAYAAYRHAKRRGKTVFNLAES